MRGSRAADLSSRLRGTVSSCCATHVLVPRLANPSLTDAPNAMYPCLPNHACDGTKGVGARRRAPTSKWIRVYYWRLLEITRGARSEELV